MSLAAIVSKIVFLLVLHETFGEPNVTEECQVSLNDFINSEEDCNGFYDALPTRDPLCEEYKEMLCQGNCAQHVKEIACRCGANNSIVSEIKSTCRCGSNITCLPPRTLPPEPVDNCTRAINSFNEDQRCVITPSDLSCTTLCHDGCRELLKDIFCKCSAMAHLRLMGEVILERVNSSCDHCLEFASRCSGDVMPPSLSLLAMLAVVLVGVVFTTS